MNTLLEPLKASDFDWYHARHLLWRAGFGGRYEEIKEYEDMGLDLAVDQLVDYSNINQQHVEQPEIDPDNIKPLTKEQRQKQSLARKNKDQEMLAQLKKQRQQRQRTDREDFKELQEWWLERIQQTTRPLEERLTLLWHSHFASKQQNVRDAYLMYQQNHLLRENASASFDLLASEIIHDPAMIKFLNNNQNNKRKPNENLARELMELFTLGEGNYTEQDISEGARALTGYTYRDNEFVFNKRVHDDDAKTILGQTSTHTGDDFVRILLAKPQCARFIAFKIYRHFVADISDQGQDWTKDQTSIIGQLARALQTHKYKIKPVLKLLLKSQHFYDPAIVGRKIKSPVHLFATTTRSLRTPDLKASKLRSAMRTMGQQLFEPPTVAGWDTGQAWINTSTLLARHNLTTTMITAGGKRNQKTFSYDPKSLLSGLNLQSASITQIADRVVDITLGNISAARRRPLYDFLASESKPTSRQSLISLLLLATTMPEYQLC
ncbi:DUF1800 domain-containing protein [Poriferisphaera corsica]|nr:DUF1800 domain-containing protein [Poriferisphaera corsica]